MGSSITIDAEERRRRANEDVLDINEGGISHEFNKGYEHEGKWYVKMDKPRKCSYKKNGKTIAIGEPIPRQKSPKGFADITPMPVELRGINLAQLRAIKANAERRCEKEGWTDWKGNLLIPEKVTMHDINKYIIIPYTKESESLFVENLPSTADTQPPRFFVSHTWGETYFRSIDFIEQMFEDFKWNGNDDHYDKKGGGMTEDTPIWICTFANNQHDLEAVITMDPSESGFAKAMEVTNYRTLSILDKDGDAFKRVWCIGVTPYPDQSPREEGEGR